jgi:UDP-2,3-diacylglucosamine hydrolase
MTSWFLSDIHIQDVNDRQSNILLQFLKSLEAEPESHQLFLVGDIFDFWLSDGTQFAKSFSVLIDQFKKLRSAGLKIYYFEGNHDFHVDVFWTKKLGIPVYENEALFQVANYKVRVEHGDFINPNDKAYLKYRAAVRKPLMEILAHRLPSRFWKPIGEYFSSKSRLKSQSYSKNNADEIRQMIRDYAKKIHRTDDFDVLITGHMHIEDDYTFKTNTGTARSINLGTWLNRPKVLRIDGTQIKMLYFNNQGELLNENT